MKNHLDGLLDKAAAPAMKPERAENHETVPFFTVRRTKGGWEYIRVNLTTDLKSVAKVVEVSNPDMKAICTERFKIAVGKYWREAENHG